MKKGFTLVELAIVIVIIGLLIGGILAGQELIKQAKISKTISELQDIDRAWNTFYLKYGGYPGDLKNSIRFFPECNNSSWGGSDVLTGDGNGVVSISEGWCAWPQLSMSGLFNAIGPKQSFTIGVGMGSLVRDVNFADGDAFSDSMSSANSSVAMQIFSGGAWVQPEMANKTLLFTESVNGAPFTSETMFSIDRKLDDSKPGSGGVRAINGPGWGGPGWSGDDCFTSSDIDNSWQPTTVSEYDLSQKGKNCALIHFF